MAQTRPKRPSDEQGGSSKKPRFDSRNPSTLALDEDDEEDLVLNADTIGKSGPQVRRNAVKLDGYESDSDNDNFNTRAANKAKREKAEASGKSKDADAEDMFADLEPADGDEDEELVKEGKKKKDVRFMDEDQIEGQVTDSKSGGHVSAQLHMDPTNKSKAADEDDESDSSGDDEDRAALPDEMDEEDAAEIGAGGKARHAPRLAAFNMSEEHEEGRFDESGNYVRKATDPDADNDNWLEGVTKKDIKKAKIAAEKRENEQRRKTMEDDAVVPSELINTLIQHLEIGETPLEALQRLNKNRPKQNKAPKWRQKRKNEMDIDKPDGNGNGVTVDPAEAATRKAIETITGAADGLFSRDFPDVYEMDRELLTRRYKRETGEDWRPPATEASLGAGAMPSTSFEFRWTDARDAGEPHGPYDAPMMKAWKEAGYFSEGVEFRRVGDHEWTRLLELE